MFLIKCQIKLLKFQKNDDGSLPTVRNSLTDENSKGNIKQNSEELKGSSLKQFEASKICEKSLKEVCGNESYIQNMTKHTKSIAKNEIDKKLDKKEIKI